MAAASGQRRVVVGVAIAESALQDSATDPALRRAIHEELMEDLAVHGRLVFTSQDHLDRFVAAVAALPTSLAKAWETVLSSKRVVVAVHDPAIDAVLSDVLDPGVLDNAMSDVPLILLEADHAELLGVADDEFSARTPGGLVEIGRMTTAGRTTTLRGARAALEAPLREGVNREVEWNERFGPLCEDSTPLVIYDRYVGQQVVRRYLYEQRSGDGLTWFLARAAMRPGRRVRIITAVSDDVDQGKRYDEQSMSLAFGRLAQTLAERGMRLDLVLVPDRVRGERGRPTERFGHDRHVRFGTRAALALGTGMQAFATPTFSETITVARLPVADAKVREERATKAAVRPPVEGWLGWTR